MGSLMFNTIISALCNPNVENPVTQNGDSFYTGDVADNFPSMLKTLALIFGIMGVIGVVLCFRKTESVVEVKNQQSESAKDKNEVLLATKPTNQLENANANVNANASGSNDNSVLMTGLKNPIFITCYIYTIISTMTGGFISNMFTSIG